MDAVVMAGVLWLNASATLPTLVMIVVGLRLVTIFVLVVASV
jgi:hypothetical protein